MTWTYLFTTVVIENRWVTTAFWLMLLYFLYEIFFNKDLKIKFSSVLCLPIVMLSYVVTLYFNNTTENFNRYVSISNHIGLSKAAYDAKIERKKQWEINKWNAIKDATEKSLIKIDLLRVDSEVRDMNDIAFDNFMKEYKGRIVEITAPIKVLKPADHYFDAREGYQGYWIVLRHRGVIKEIPSGRFDPATLFGGKEPTRTIGFDLTYQFSGNCEVDQNFSVSLINKKIDDDVTVRSYIGRVKKRGFEASKNWCIIIP